MTAIIDEMNCPCCEKTIVVSVAFGKLIEAKAKEQRKLPVKSKPTKPKKARSDGRGRRKGQTGRCSKCGKAGHYAKTCKGK